MTDTETVGGDKHVTTAIEPIRVTVIGGTGDGGAPLRTGTLAETPDHQPNLIVTVVTPVMALAIRFINAYVGMVVGLLGVGETSKAIPAPDFWHLLLKCMGLAIGGAVVLSLKDVVTLFAKLEKKYPLLTGNV